MSTSELNDAIRKLQQHIWRMESVVCGPVEREKLRADLKALYAEKAALVAERDGLIRDQNAAAVSQMGGRSFSNDARTAEQVRADIAEVEQRRRQKFQDELNALGNLLQPRTL